MDEYSGKRAINGLVVSRKGPGHAGMNRDQNAQFCNRVGCSGNLNSMKINQVGCSEKAKSLRPSFRSASTSKEVVGSSSRTSASVSKPRKPFTESRRKAPFRTETDSSENSSIQEEPEVSKFIPSSRKVRRSFLESGDVEPSKEAMMEAGNSSAVSNTRSRSMNVKSVSNAREISTSCASLATKSSVQATQANTSRYGLRNLRCNSVSDVVPSGCSPPNANPSRRKDVPKKRNSEGENSSLVRGKKLSEGRSCNSSQGVSISDSRRSRNGQPPRDGIAGSVRTRRPVNGYTRARLSDQETGNSSSPTESLVVSPHSPRPEISREAPFNRPSSRSSSNGSLRSIMPSSPRGVGITRSFMNRDGFHHSNMDGIAEVLLALERIEQDEELTYEQLLVLETNLFIGGLNLYDQHREMRLDIDNMSYEELLALEERMGSVSTALTEEALSKCLRTSIYQPIPDDDGILGCVTVSDEEDDVKCSICQEEYGMGDELGRLECEHKYHVGCIHQWLRLKNWCPICKTAAAST